MSYLKSYIDVLKESYIDDSFKEDWIKEANEEIEKSMKEFMES